MVILSRPFPSFQGPAPGTRLEVEHGSSGFAGAGHNQSSESGNTIALIWSPCDSDVFDPVLKVAKVGIECPFTTAIFMNGRFPTKGPATIATL